MSNDIVFSGKALTEIVMLGAHEFGNTIQCLMALSVVPMASAEPVESVGAVSR